MPHSQRKRRFTSVSDLRNTIEQEWQDINTNSLVSPVDSYFFLFSKEPEYIIAAENTDCAKLNTIANIVSVVWQLFFISHISVFREELVQCNSMLMRFGGSSVVYCEYSVVSWFLSILGVFFRIMDSTILL